MAESNDLLRCARERTESPRTPGQSLSRDELADLVNAYVFNSSGRVIELSGNYIGKLERGQIKRPNAEYRAALRAVLGAATDAELGFSNGRRMTKPGCAPSVAVAWNLPEQSDDELLPGTTAGLRVWMRMNRRELMQLATLGIPLTMAAAGLDGDQQDHLGRVASSSLHVDQEALSHIQAIADSATQQYETFGAPAVVDTFHAQLRLTDLALKNSTATLRPQLLSLRAALARMMGWMAFDMDDFPTARFHYEQARTAASEAGDHAMVAFVLGNMCRLERAAKRPDIGADYAIAAQARARAAGDTLMMAYAADQAAGAYSQTRQTQECHQQLALAQKWLASATDPGQSPIAYCYNQAMSTWIRGGSLLKLGDNRAAKDTAAEAFAQFGTTHVRSRALAMVDVASASLAEGEIDESAAALIQAKGIAGSYPAARLTSGIRDARDALHAAAPGSAAIRELDSVLAESAA